MVIFAAICNQKQTTGAMKGAILYIVDSRKKENRYVEENGSMLAILD